MALHSFNERTPLTSGTYLQPKQRKNIVQRRNSVVYSLQKDAAKKKRAMNAAKVPDGTNGQKASKVNVSAEASKRWLEVASKVIFDAATSTDHNQQLMNLKFVHSSL